MDCRSCQIIELAMISVVDGEIVDEYDEFIKVDGLLQPKITEITGITDEMLKNKGLDEKTVANDLKEKLDDNTLMIAHNAQFDLSFVYNLLKRYFPAEAEDLVRNADWLDTLTVFKDRAEYPHKLIDAVKHYDVAEVNFHRAIDDTKALYEVTKAMKNERDDLAEYINVFGYNPKFGVSGERFSFIEYKRQYYHNGGMIPQEDILPRK